MSKLDLNLLGEMIEEGKKLMGREVKEHEPQDDYIRVGTDYFKMIIKPDRFGINRHEMKKWNVETLKLDFNREFPSLIKKYDDFIISPSNKSNLNGNTNCYNMYHEFRHKPRKGKWPWTFVMMKQIFGTQFKIGMQYLKVLYENPRQALPILVLVSVERGTGKSTFLDWLNMVFGANMTMIEPDVIGSTFNAEYATSNIIGVDETILDKQVAVEKIKSLATKKFISVNMKNVSQFKLPFFGKIIMASNNEDKFMKVDDKEIRFWVRKIGGLRIENHNILNDMICEIPAYLSYLKSMKPIDFTHSRMVFTPNQIKNEYLEAVKHESRSSLHKELIELFTDFFMGNSLIECFCTPGDIKQKFFVNNNNIDRTYIRRVIKQGFCKSTPSKTMSYKSFDSFDSKVGRPFEFSRSEFDVEDAEVEKSGEVMPF